MAAGRADESGLIVVGVDGSASSKEALRWAAHQAELTGAAVSAVIAWEYPSLYGWGAALPGEDFAATAGAVLAEAVRETLGQTPSVEVRESVEVGHPAQVLLNASRDAQLLVVGSRGHGGVTGALLGSVSQHCANHARCPVVIIRKED